MSFLGKNLRFLRGLLIATVCVFAAANAANADTFLVTYDCVGNDPNHPGSCGLVSCGGVGDSPQMVEDNCDNAINGAKNDSFWHATRCNTIVIKDQSNGTSGVPSSGCVAPLGYKLAGWRINNTQWLVQPGDIYAVQDANGHGTFTDFGQNPTFHAVWTRVNKTFEITTTSNTSSFKIRFAARGKWMIDWGDGQTTEVNRMCSSCHAQQEYSHTYSSAGSYTIGIYMDSTHPGADRKGKYVFSRVKPVIEFGDTTKIASIDGCLGCLFNSSWERRYNVTSPEEAILYHNSPSFSGVFRGATNLTGQTSTNPGQLPENKYAIPPDLFVGAPSHLMWADSVWDIVGGVGMAVLTIAVIAATAGAAAGAAVGGWAALGYTGLTNAAGEALTVLGAVAIVGTGGFLTGWVPETFFPSTANETVDIELEAKYYETFMGCSGLSGKIPPYLFGSAGDVKDALWLVNHRHMGRGGAFQRTFSGCSGLAGSIPGTLFGNIETMSNEDLLFYLPPSFSFMQTFNGCSNLNGSLPRGLFRLAKGYAKDMFHGTFNGCSRLSGDIPADLFGNLGPSADSEDFSEKADSMFRETFAYCYHLGGEWSNSSNSYVRTHFVQPALFGKKSERWHGKSAPNFMEDIFKGSPLLRITCPENYVEYVNGFRQEYWWDYANLLQPPQPQPGHVISCVPGNNLTVKEMTLNPNGGAGGPAKVYENLNVGWALSSSPDSWNMDDFNIGTVPGRGENYLFRGYYKTSGNTAPQDVEFVVGTGPTGPIMLSGMKINKNGNLDIQPTINENQTWYAAWAKKCENMNIPHGSCTTSVLTVFGKVTYTLTCDTGYEKSGWSCVPKTSVITLDNGGASTPGTESVDAVYGDAIYLDANDPETKLKPNDNSVNIGVPSKYFTVSYDLSNSPGATMVWNDPEHPEYNTNVERAFDGYFETASAGSTKYIDGKGVLQQAGEDVGTAYTSPHTWYAHWGDGYGSLPGATRPGYTLVRWLTTPNCTDSSCYAGDPGAGFVVSGDITLYPQWTETIYLITFCHPDAANANVLSSTAFLKYGDSFYHWYENGVVSSSFDRLSAIPERDGYQFMGYVGGSYNGAPPVNNRGCGSPNPGMDTIFDKDGNVTSRGTTFTTSDTYIYARWTNGVYDIALDPNGGQFQDNVRMIYLEYNHGFYSNPGNYNVGGIGPSGAISSVTPPTRPGYDFQGYYYTNPVGNESVQITDEDGALGDNYTFTRENTDIVAQWTPAVYKVLLKHDDADNAAQLLDVAYVKYGEGWYEDHTLTSSLGYGLKVIPNRLGYDFMGYYDTVPAVAGGDRGGANPRSGPGQTAPIIDSGGGFMSNTFTTTDNTTITAVWSPVVYEITLDDNGADGLAGDPNTIYLHYGNGWYRDNNMTQSISELDQIPSRYGYRFAGYLGGTSNILVINDDGELQPNALQFTHDDTTITAQWEPKIIEITLNDNGAVTTAGAPHTFYLQYGRNWWPNAAANTTPMAAIDVAPQLTGYDFAGYYTAPVETTSGNSPRDHAIIQIVEANRNLKTTEEAKTFTDRDSEIYAAWTPACNAVSLGPNGGTAGSVATLYKVTGEPGWYQDSNCETPWPGGNTVVPYRTGYTFRGFYAAPAPGTVTANTATPLTDYPYITNSGSGTVYGNYWLIDEPATLYAAWAQDCVNSPTNATCGLDVDENGAVTYTTACTGELNGVQHGYTPVANTMGTYNPSCSANCNTITLDNTTNGGATATGSYGTLYKYTDSVKWYRSKTNATTCANEVTQIGAPTKTHATFTRYIDGDDTNVGSGTPNVTLSNSWTVTGNETITAQYLCDSNYLLNSNTGVCEAEIYTITLDDNGNNDIVSAGDGYLYEVYGDHWSLNSTGTPPLQYYQGGVWLNSTPSRGNDYVFRGYFLTDLLDVVATGNPGGDQMTVQKHLLVEGDGDADLFEESTTWYAGWARQCVANPTNATCSLVVDNDGMATYTTACAPVCGYTMNPGAGGTYNPSCSANTINLDWNENNNNGTALNNGQCTYGGNLTLASAPIYTGYDFMYWKLHDNTYQSAGATVANGCVSTKTGQCSNNDNTDITAVWCHSCTLGSHVESCDVSYDTTNQECEYTPVCEDGYELGTSTNPYEPVCQTDSFTITYKPGTGASGTNAVQNVTYSNPFDLYNYSQVNFTKLNHVLKAWTPSVGGFSVPGASTLPLGEHYDSYNVAANSEMAGDWGECQCNIGTGALTCVAPQSPNPAVVDNACQFVVTCDTANGYQQSTAAYTCDTANGNPHLCTATCVAGHTITLNGNGATIPGTASLYTIEAGGVYRDAARTSANLMTQIAHPINEAPYSLPQRAYTVTYDTKGGDLPSGVASTATATYTFTGYYNDINAQNPVKYIAGIGDTNPTPGHITTDGNTAGIAYTADAAWTAGWLSGTITLPSATRDGYIFGGWYTDETYERPSGGMQPGATYTPDADVILYAKWNPCADGYYCTNNTSTQCPSGYIHSDTAASAQSECYVTCSAGTGVLTANSTCSVVGANKYQIGSHDVYYGNITPKAGADSDSPVVGTIYNCPTNYKTIGSTAQDRDERGDCKRTISLGKNGGSGTLTGTNVTDNNGGTNAATIVCSAGVECTLPDASILTRTGYEYLETWGIDTDSTDCISSVNTPTVGKYYACRVGLYSTVSLMWNYRFSSSGDALVTTVNAQFGSAMPTVDTNDEPLEHLVREPAYSGANMTTRYEFGGYWSNRITRTPATTYQYYTTEPASAKAWNLTGSRSLYADWNMQCEPKYYLAAGGYQCTACPAGSYCPGSMCRCTGADLCPNLEEGQTSCDCPSTVTYCDYNASEAQGAIECPTGYTDGAAGSASSQSQCVKSVAEDYYVAEEYGDAVACPLGYGTVAHTVNYGGTSSCTPKEIACAVGTYLHVTLDENDEPTAYACEPCLLNYYCIGGTWTYDGNDHGLTDCPVPSANKRSSLPTTNRGNFVSWDATFGGGTGTDYSNDVLGKSLPTQCKAINWLWYARGRLFEVVYYNQISTKYDTLIGANAYGWSDASAGYYLTSKKTCGDTYAGNYGFYSSATECPAGGYCEGKSRATCVSPGNVSAWTTTFGLKVCANDYYSDAGASACTQCNVSNGYHNTHSGHSAGTLTGEHFALHAGMASCKASCGPGYCVATANAACAQVGINGWAPAAAVSQGATNCTNHCPYGLVTSGFGPGADEANDCGYILHIGDKQLYLRRGRKTNPSLNFNINNRTFYGNMYALTNDVAGNIKMSYSDQTYIVCDETAEVCSGVDVPSDFTILEYLQTFGGEKVTTDLYFDFDQDYRIIGNVVDLDGATRNIIFGTYDGSGGNTVNFELYTDSKFRTYAATPVAQQFSSAVSTNKNIRYEAVYDPIEHTMDTTVTVDGITQEMSLSLTGTRGVTSSPFAFFRDHRISTAGILTASKIGEHRVYQNGKLIRYYVPVRRNSNNELGMYEVITGQFLKLETPSGTGGGGGVSDS